MLSLSDIISTWEAFWQHPRVFIPAAFFGALITFSVVKTLPSLVNADIATLKGEVASLKEGNDSLSKGNATLQAKLANALTDAGEVASLRKDNDSLLKEKAAWQAKLESANTDAKDLRASLVAAEDRAKKYDGALRAEKRALSEAQSRLTALQAENAELSKHISASSQESAKPEPVVLSDDAKKVLTYFFSRSLASDVGASKALDMTYGKIALAIHQLESNGFLKWHGGESGGGLFGSYQSSDYQVTPEGAAFAERNGITGD